MIKAFFHIIVAFTVFTSSTGLWINQHYCQNEVVKNNLFFGVKNACSHADHDPCFGEKNACSHSDKQENEDDCCETESSYFKPGDDQKVEITGNELSEKDIDFSSSIFEYKRLIPVNNQTLLFSQYLSPLILFDHQVRFQQFLC